MCFYSADNLPDHILMDSRICHNAATFNLHANAFYAQCTINVKQQTAGADTARGIKGTLAMNERMNDLINEALETCSKLVQKANEYYSVQHAIAHKNGTLSKVRCHSYCKTTASAHSLTRQPDVRWPTAFGTLLRPGF